MSQIVLGALNKLPYQTATHYGVLCFPAFHRHFRLLNYTPLSSNSLLYPIKLLKPSIHPSPLILSRVAECGGGAYPRHWVHP